MQHQNVLETHHTSILRVGRLLLVTALLATISACAGLRPEDRTEAVSIDREAALQAVNAFRAENGLKPVSADQRLMRAAEIQSAAMAARDRMDHAVAGRLPGRVDATGYAWSTTAENIGRGYRDYDAAMRGWITSPAHRRNLLNASVTEIGFGAARDRKGGRKYWTQIFAAPKAAVTPGG